MKGRLKSHAEYWEVLGTSEFVCGVITNGYMLPFVYMLEPKLFSNHSSVLILCQKLLVTSM